MNINELKEIVFEANIELVQQKLVIYTWGNASAIDRENNLIAIKPSGVSYKDMRPEHMVIIDLQGNIVDGKLKPSSDTPTHLVLYNQFPGIGGVVHTHSTAATSWAQAGVGIPAFGTTHADYFYGEVPCTRAMTDAEINGAYEHETGNVIVERFKDLNPLFMPAVLVNSHGPFTWGPDVHTAVHNSVVLEELARMAMNTLAINKVGPMQQTLLDKHFLRKHGKNAYYGQK